MSTRPLLLSVVAISVAVLSPRPAHAISCAVRTQAVAFGKYDPFAHVPTEGTGNVRVACDADVPYSIQISSGHGTYTSRRMINGANPMAYNLYVDTTRSMVWGNGNDGTGTVSRSGNALVPVYGRIPANQLVPPGTYSDVTLVTVVY